MLLMMLFSMILSMSFLFIKHPVSMMMMILTQTILVSLMCGTMSNLWWFSYMLFMVMIGGLLVLFMYMTNVASNEKFKTKKIKLIMGLITVTFIMTMFLDSEIFQFTNVSTWSNFNNMNMPVIIMKYYNYPSNMILFLMMIYLLITMIMSVKITDLTKGALRQKY